MVHMQVQKIKCQNVRRVAVGGAEIHIVDPVPGTITLLHTCT